MPKAMEKALMKTAKRRGYSKKQTGTFVYGTMKEKGWKPSKQKKGEFQEMMGEMKQQRMKHYRQKMMK